MDRKFWQASILWEYGEEKYPVLFLIINHQIRPMVLHGTVENIHLSKLTHFDIYTASTIMRGKLRGAASFIQY